jgi:hypothetical protein
MPVDLLERGVILKRIKGYRSCVAVSFLKFLEYETVSIKIDEAVSCYLRLSNDRATTAMMTSAKAKRSL